MQVLSGKLLCLRFSIQGLINDMEQTAELGDSSNSSEVLLSLSASDRDTTVLADSGINGDEVS